MNRYCMLIRSSLLVLLFIMLFSSFAHAQESIPADNFTYYIRNIQDANELMPLAKDDPNYKEPEAELTIVININDFNNVKSLKIDLGDQINQSNIRKWEFNMVENEGKKYLKKGDKLNPVNDGKVIITETVPASIYQKRIHLILKTADKNGLETIKNRKQFN